MTPGDFVEHLRLDAARRLLKEADLPAEQISRCCSVGEPDTMCRVFLRRLGVTPATTVRVRSSDEPAVRI